MVLIGYHLEKLFPIVIISRLFYSTIIFHTNHNRFISQINTVGIGFFSAQVTAFRQFRGVPASGWVLGPPGSVNGRKW